MKRFQLLTRSYVALGMLTLTLLAGFSVVAFADDMSKGMAKDKMMDMDMTKDKMMDKGMAKDKMMGMGMTNINTATAKQMEKLPGIGKELAKRIVDYRTTNGDFKSVQDVAMVKGIGKQTMAKMKAHMTIGTDTETHMSK